MMNIFQPVYMVLLGNFQQFIIPRQTPFFPNPVKISDYVPTLTFSKEIKEIKDDLTKYHFVIYRFWT